MRIVEHAAAPVACDDAPVDLRWLRTFLAVADEQHLRRAAARLSLSPAAVSRQLRQLEREAGTPLFTRRPRLHLTPAGYALVLRGQQLLDGWEATRAALREPHHGRPRTVVLGLDDFGAGPLNLPLVQALRQVAAPHRLLVRQLPEQSQFTALPAGQADLVLGGLLDVDPRLQATVLATQPRGVFLPGGDDLAHAPRVLTGDLLDRPLTRYRPGMPPAWTAYWHLHDHRGGPARLSRTVVTDHASLLVAVGLDGAAGPGNALLAEHVRAPGVTFRAVADLPPAPVSIAVRRDHDDDLLHRLVAAAGHVATAALQALPRPLLTATGQTPAPEVPG